MAGAGGDNLSWDYGCMKIDVAKHLTLADCKDIGQLIGLKPGELDRIKAAGDLLRELEKKALISQNNVQYLKKLLVQTELMQAAGPIDAYQQKLDSCNSMKAASEENCTSSKNTDQPDYSKEHMKLPVTEVQLSMVADVLGGRWKQFSLQKLKLTQPQIDNCEYSNRNLPDVIFQCLYTWRQMNGSSATVGELTRLLSEFGYGKEAWGVLE